MKLRVPALCRDRPAGELKTCCAQKMLHTICQKISCYTAKDLPVALPEAAVLVAITCNHTDPQIVFTERAAHLNTHGGEVAFPGGKRDKADANLAFTALRESNEEIALACSDACIIGRIDQVISQFGIKVTPFIAMISERAELHANEQELNCIFKVPVRWFMQQLPQIDCCKSKSGFYMAPSYSYENHRIWGMTACILACFLNIVFGAEIPAIVVDSHPEDLKFRPLPYHNASVYPMSGVEERMLRYVTK